MPSLVVTGQQVKEGQRGEGEGGHNVPPPAYILTKIPQSE